jgi:hypothetical protein
LFLFWIAFLFLITDINKAHGFRLRETEKVLTFDSRSTPHFEFVLDEPQMVPWWRRGRCERAQIAIFVCLRTFFGHVYHQFIIVYHHGIVPRDDKHDDK